MRRLTNLFKEFFENEKTGGIILVIVTAASLLLANSAFGESYIGLWQRDIDPHTITEWINDGLMAIFFLLIGLELEREIYIGELSKIRNAALPIVGALGGMVVPAGIYLLLNYGTPTQSGAGIPMATDIAFAIGILSLLGNRVPVSLKIFLTALAVIDDLGAIFVIALFYTKSISFYYLLSAFGVWAVMLLLNRIKVRSLVPYLVLGVLMWYLMLHSGIHPTITGVLVAFAIPFGNGDRNSTSYILQHWLHKPVAFVILPLFAIANTAIAIGAGFSETMTEPEAIGIVCGLVVGKPLGIVLFCALGAALKLCTMPKGVKWKHLCGVGFLGGIGFTMSIFISMLAFSDSAVINTSKLAILIASVLAAAIGYALLHFTLKPAKKSV